MVGGGGASSSSKGPAPRVLRNSPPVKFSNPRKVAGVVPSSPSNSATAGPRPTAASPIKADKTRLLSVAQDAHNLWEEKILRSGSVGRLRGVVGARTIVPTTVAAPMSTVVPPNSQSASSHSSKQGAGGLRSFAHIPKLTPPQTAVRLRVQPSSPMHPPGTLSGGAVVQHPPGILAPWQHQGRIVFLVQNLYLYYMLCPRDVCDDTRPRCASIVM